VAERSFDVTRWLTKLRNTWHEHWNETAEAENRSGRVPIDATALEADPALSSGAWGTARYE
jgi:hypothetical protein